MVGGDVGREHRAGLQRLQLHEASPLGPIAHRTAAGPLQPPPAPRGARQPHGQLHVIVEAAV